MKACISSSGNSLESPVDPRFGRAVYFMIVDTDTLDHDAVENPALSAGGGAGTQAAQLVIQKGAQSVLTGNIGPNAFEALQAAGVQVYTGVSGSVKEAVDKIRNNELTAVDAPSVGAHHGSGGRGMGAGRGRNR